MKVDWPFGPGQSASVKALVGIPLCDLTAPELAQTYAFLCLTGGPRSPKALEMLEQLELRECMLDDFLHGKYCELSEASAQISGAVETTLTEMAYGQPETVGDAVHRKMHSGH